MVALRESSSQIGSGMWGHHYAVALCVSRHHCAAALGACGGHRAVARCMLGGCHAGVLYAHGGHLTVSLCVHGCHHTGALGPCNRYHAVIVSQGLWAHVVIVLWRLRACTVVAAWVLCTHIFVVMLSPCGSSVGPMCNNNNIQWLKKVSQCLAIFERMTWHKSGKLYNNLKIIDTIGHHLRFLTSPRSRDLD